MWPFSGSLSYFSSIQTLDLAVLGTASLCVPSVSAHDPEVTDCRSFLLATLISSTAIRFL